MISVIILTKNEEVDLPNCLNSLKWADDIHILDSGSTDNTIEIARQGGAKISTNAFHDFGQQRNFALDQLTIKNEWILFLDADEVVTEKFRASVFAAIKQTNSEVAGFYCCWKMILEGRWLRYSDNFPKWQFRIMRKGRARFTNFGHGQKEDCVQGKIDYIKEPYLHYGFSKGWSHWIDRHNRYSNYEAAARLCNQQPVKNIFSTHGSFRNSALKPWLSKLPGWPFIRFFYSYFINLGFLEGMPGFIYCINMAYYEFLIQIKMREIKKKKKALIP